MKSMRVIVLLFVMLLASCAGIKKNTATPPHEVGIAYLNLGSGEILAYNAQTLFHAASTMKTPVMFQLFLMRDLGVIDLRDRILVRNSFASIVDGSLYSIPMASQADEILYPRLNQYVSYYELIENMITYSSNLATNTLMEYTRADSISATLERIDANGVLVLRGVEDLKAYELGLNNVTSAYGMMKVMEAVYRSELVSDSSRTEMLEILGRQHFNSMIPAGLPQDVKVAHKTGSITRIAHDAAIVFPPDADPFVLVVLTRGWDAKSEAVAAGARIAEKVYAYHLGKLTREDIVIPDLIQ